MNVGIDGSKAWLDVAVQASPQRVEQAQFAKAPEGGRRLQGYLQKRVGKGAPVCLEAPGSYGEEEAEYLYEGRRRRQGG